VIRKQNAPAGGHAEPGLISKGKLGDGNLFENCSIWCMLQFERKSEFKISL